MTMKLNGTNEGTIQIMAKATINIATLMEAHTNKLISTSSYYALRKYLLERNPLANVFINVKQELSDICAYDKQSFATNATQEATLAQSQSDAEEERRDGYDKSRDEDRQKQLQAELTKAQDSWKSLTSRCKELDQSITNMVRPRRRRRGQPWPGSELRTSLSKAQQEKQVAEQQCYELTNTPQSFYVCSLGDKRHFLLAITVWTYHSKIFNSPIISITVYVVKPQINWFSIPCVCHSASVTNNRNQFVS